MMKVAGAEGRPAAKKADAPVLRLGESLSEIFTWKQT
jgi:hypothetical protein